MGSFQLLSFFLANSATVYFRSSIIAFEFLLSFFSFSRRSPHSATTLTSQDRRRSSSFSFRRGVMRDPSLQQDSQAIRRMRTVIRSLGSMGSLLRFLIWKQRYAFHKDRRIGSFRYHSIDRRMRSTEEQERAITLF